MISKSILKFVLVIISIISVSCEKSFEPVSNFVKLDTLYSTEHYLWPSKVGNYWDYEAYAFLNHFSTDSNWAYRGFNSFNIDLDTVQSSPSLYRLEIVDSVFINIKDTVYECHVFDSYDLVTQKYRNLKFPYWIGENGIFSMGIYVDGKDTLFNKGLYIPSQIPLNINWQGQIAARIDGYYLETRTVIERKCLSKNEILNTPMGDFECYVIFTRIWQAADIYGYYDFYEYYVDGLGIICSIRLSVMPEAPNGSTHWWLDYISIVYSFSII